MRTPQGRIIAEADRQHSAITWFTFRLHAGEQDCVEEELKRRMNSKLSSENVNASLTREDVEAYVKMLNRILAK